MTSLALLSTKGDPRKRTRFPIRSACRWLLISRDHFHWKARNRILTFGETVNLSSSGAFIVCGDNVPPLHSVVHLFVTWPANPTQTMIVRARVVRHEPQADGRCAFAVQFRQRTARITRLIPGREAAAA